MSSVEPDEDDDAAFEGVDLIGETVPDAAARGPCYDHRNITKK